MSDGELKDATALLKRVSDGERVVMCRDPIEGRWLVLSDGVLQSLEVDAAYSIGLKRHNLQVALAQNRSDQEVGRLFDQHDVPGLAEHVM